ncbi:MAG: hypothetical protein EP332_04950 [Bacteroidetes bacterium]|nr:MAG: hypothetical protein EP332_04950 [Bacteroidota bacterium]
MLLRDWWTFIRGVNLLIIALVMYLVQYQLVLYGIPTVPKDEADLILFWLILSTIFISIGGNVINDYFDQSIDQINKPEKTFVGKKITAKNSLLFYIGCNISALISLLVLVQNTGLDLWLLIFPITGISLYFYAAKLKKSLLIGNLLIAILSGLVPLLPYLSLEHLVPVSQSTSSVIVLALIAFWTTLIREIIKDKLDIEGDTLAGANTLAIQLDSKKLIRLLCVFIAAVPLLSFWFYSLIELKPIPMVLAETAIGVCSVVLLRSIVIEKPNWKAASQWSKILMLSGLLGLLLRF